MTPSGRCGSTISIGPSASETGTRSSGRGSDRTTSLTANSGRQAKGIASGPVKGDKYNIRVLICPYPLFQSVPIADVRHAVGTAFETLAAAQCNGVLQGGCHLFSFLLEGCKQLRLPIIAFKQLRWIRTRARPANIDKRLCAGRKRFATAVRRRTRSSDQASENQAWNEVAQDERSEEFNTFQQSWREISGVKLEVDVCTRDTKTSNTLKEGCQCNVMANRPKMRLLLRRLKVFLVRHHNSSYAQRGRATDAPFQLPVRGASC